MLNFGSAVKSLCEHKGRCGRHVNTLTTTLEDSVELTVNQDIRVAADWGGEVRVERNIESVVAVLGNVEHTRAEVLRTR